MMGMLGDAILGLVRSCTGFFYLWVVSADASHLSGFVE